MKYINLKIFLIGIGYEFIANLSIDGESNQPLEQVLFVCIVYHLAYYLIKKIS